MGRSIGADSWLAGAWASLRCTRKRPPTVAASWLIRSGDLVEGNLQLCSSLLAIPFLKFPLPTLESDQFLLRRLMKAVAWCYCQLSVTRHHAPPTVTRNLSTISKCWNRRKVRVSSITEWRGCHIVVAQPLHSDQRLELQDPARNRAPPGQCISSPAAYLFATTRPVVSRTACHVGLKL